MKNAPPLAIRAQELLEPLGEWAADQAPSPSQLREISKTLRHFVRSPAWQASSFREAAAGEELVYALATSAQDGPALYLVSDGPFVSSQPHSHDTWSVMFGIRGCELNHFYALQSTSGRVVVRSWEAEVGPQSVLGLGPQDIHSTDVRGSIATFHLHIYGRPLHALQSFASRCYSVAGVV